MVKVKDDGPPINCPRILPEILKFSSSLHMVKDDWPPYTSTAQDFTRNFNSWSKLVISGTEHLVEL